MSGFHLRGLAVVVLVSAAMLSADGDGAAAPLAAQQALAPRPSFAAQALVPLRAPAAASSTTLDPEACKRLPPEDLLNQVGNPSNQILAECVVRHAQDFGALVLRPAVTSLSSSADPSTLVHLGKILGNSPPATYYDTVTRAYSAAAIGRIINGATRSDPTFAAPGVVLHQLSSCIASPLPRVVRHACMNAAGDANLRTLVPDLEAVLQAAPPLDQFVAGRVLTRLTGTSQVSTAVAGAAKTELQTFIAP